jgi:hypothetical protein
MTRLLDESKPWDESEESEDSVIEFATASDPSLLIDEAAPWTGEETWIAEESMRGDMTTFDLDSQPDHTLILHEEAPWSESDVSGDESLITTLETADTSSPPWACGDVTTFELDTQPDYTLILYEEAPWNESDMSGDESLIPTLETAKASSPSSACDITIWTLPSGTEQDLILSEKAPWEPAQEAAKEPAKEPATDAVSDLIRRAKASLVRTSALIGQSLLRPLSTRCSPLTCRFFRGKSRGDPQGKCGDYVAVSRHPLANDRKCL